MGATGNKGATTQASQTSAFNLGDVENQKFLKAVDNFKQSYLNNIDIRTSASASAKQTWKDLSDAAQRILDFKGLPKLLTGNAAAVVFNVLPQGSLISIDKSSDNYNGTWIKGTGSGGSAVWTHLTMPDGSKDNAGHHKGTDSWGSFGSGTLKVVRYGKKK